MTDTLVFVYGSLKRGFHNNDLLDTSYFVGTGTTPPDFEMYSAGGFPVIVYGDKSITGEVYLVDEPTLKRLDRLESNGHMYQRELKWIEEHQLYAWIYVFMHEVKGMLQEKITHGDGVQTWVGNGVEVDMLLDA